MDMIYVAQLICRNRKIPYQDVAKAGLKFGDEGEHSLDVSL